MKEDYGDVRGVAMPIRKSSAVAFMCALFFVADARATTTANEISYKGSRFGVSEKVFLQQHSNEGFVCAEAPTKVGRWCSGKATTYVNWNTETTAQFLDNKLVLVSVFFRESADGTLEAMIDTAIVSSLAKRYGPSNEVAWPSQTKNG